MPFVLNFDEEKLIAAAFALHFFVGKSLHFFVGKSTFLRKSLHFFVGNSHGCHDIIAVKPI